MFFFSAGKDAEDFRCDPVGWDNPSQEYSSQE